MAEQIGEESAAPLADSEIPSSIAEPEAAPDPDAGVVHEDTNPSPNS